MANSKRWAPFWDRVYSNVTRQGACLVFIGCTDDCGYGRITRDDKLVRIHREVWARDNGPIPDGLVVMHTCDNPPCIEPAHLRLGTQTENIEDMVQKGRRVVLKGTLQIQAKLTDNDIPLIRHWVAAGYSTSKIARAFGVSDGAIQHVKLGRRWTHVLSEAA